MVPKFFLSVFSIKSISTGPLFLKSCVSLHTNVFAVQSPTSLALSKYLGPQSYKVMFSLYGNRQSEVLLYFLE